MKRRNNNISLLILMIVSQLMLSSLVIQWLRSQWQAEKESFIKEMNEGFRESVDQVLDTMLVKHLIVPVLNDSMKPSGHLVTFKKSLKPGDYKTKQNITALFNRNGKEKKAFVTISLGDSVKSHQDEDVVFRSYDSSRKTLLLRGLRLIIKETEDSTGDGNHFNHLVSAIPDTALLKKMVEQRLAKPGYNLKFRWLSLSRDVESAKNGSSVFIESYLFDKPFGAEIRHFNNIILKGISVQILFGFVLLLLTGAAFLITWRSLKKMEALNTLRNDFISNISHELKTPVSTISVALEALKNFDRLKDPVKSSEYLDIARTEMRRLDNLITQVLNTSQLEGQDQFFQMYPTDVVVLTREVLNSMQVRFTEQKAKVVFNTDQDSGLLKLDKLHIQGVLINLIDNSLKYGAENPEISISIKHLKTSVKLTVSDNGPGIPEEYLSKVFDKFFRVPHGDMHNVKGYGLGLSFADLVMRHHSGSISVVNIKEGGCSFTLTFPKNN